jgi:fido (protein-threonine AMPylation protein)
VQAIAEVHVELILIHPFRVGVLQAGNACRTAATRQTPAFMGESTDQQQGATPALATQNN